MSIYEWFNFSDMGCDTVKTQRQMRSEQADVNGLGRQARRGDEGE